MDLAPAIFQDLATIIRGESGIILGPEKAYLVRHRLEPLIRAANLDNFQTLVKKLHLPAGLKLRNAVIDAITVKETRFFRDPSCFESLLEHVLPAFVREIHDSKRSRRIRIWSAAAATGQEAYSVAMLVRELAASESPGQHEDQVAILASDISTGAIEKAQAARYTPAEVRRGLSEPRLRRHCHLRDDHWHINDAVRRLVRFRSFNLLHPAAELGAFDVILCRNVLIYFDNATRRKTIQHLAAALRPGGWLVLGSAESLYGMEDRFETQIHGRTILYRKPHQLPLEKPHAQPHVSRAVASHFRGGLARPADGRASD